jgi:surfeit locus 1 family protein
MRGLRRVLLAVATLVACSATFSLGLWQWGRAHEKLALQAAIESRQAMPPLDNAAVLQSADPSALHHRPVVLRGRWDAAHTVFLDNRQMEGRVGFYVVTPLLLSGSTPPRAVLVQRGWAPRDFQERGRLPPVATPVGEVTVQGRLAPPPAKLYELKGEGAGPIRQNLDLAQFGAETRLALLPVSVQQLGGPSEGLLRQWPQAASGAGKNYGYAFQWWALCALIAILYVWFQFVAPRRAPRRA